MGADRTTASAGSAARAPGSCRVTDTRTGAMRAFATLEEAYPFLLEASGMTAQEFAAAVGDLVARSAARRAADGRAQTARTKETMPEVSR